MSIARGPLGSPRASGSTRRRRTVLDTNVALDLLVFRDPGAASLARAIEVGDVLPVSSPDCMQELQRVLAYPQFGLDFAARLATVERYRAMVRIVEVPAQTISLPHCSDQDDQKFLELAWHARACCLVTKDKALLRMRPALKGAGGFAIVAPGEFNSCMAG